MHGLTIAAGLTLAAIVLWDSFETILLPRRASGNVRLTRWVITGLWWAWRLAARPVRTRPARIGFLSVFGIFGLLVLLAVWAAGLILAFGLLHWGAGANLRDPQGPPGFGTCLYFSASTFFTLGLGEVVPVGPLERLLAVIEAGMGFGFLALMLSYLPVLYQAFSRRESRITMLDEWAGSPPSAGQLLRRAGEARDPRRLDELLRDWETTTSELLESHLSYPILAFFRSQHDNQSWLASLTTVLDACAIVTAGLDDVPPFQARMTFAIARHAVVDVSQVFALRPRSDDPERLPPAELARLREWLGAHGVTLPADEGWAERVTDARRLYEPYVHALARHLWIELPGWLPPERQRFNWLTTAGAAGRAHGDEAGGAHR
jgi:hypothetical protein